MLVVLESLTPAEREAFLLHDVFGYSFTEVARIVGRTPEAARQLAARARRSVAARRPRFPASAEEQRRIVEAFLGAAQEGELATLLELLNSDVTYRSDGGGLVPAAPHPLVGADRVARALVTMAHHFQGEFAATIADVNGAPGLVIDNNSELSVVAFTVDGGRIRSIDGIRNPAKRRHLAQR
jgi:RNA polymerase sigma-70 factor (ECF subfamily)